MSAICGSPVTGMCHSSWLDLWCYVIGLSGGSIAVATLPHSTPSNCPWRHNPLDYSM